MGALAQAMGRRREKENSVTKYRGKSEIG